MSDSEAAEAETKDHEVHLAPGEGDEAAYGDASRRAVEAFDTIPADSEHEVDYPVDEENADGQKADGGSDTVKELLRPEVGRVSNVPGGYELVPALAVELSITTPDGRSFQVSEAQEFGDFPMIAPTDEAVVDMIGSVADAARRRFVGPGGFLR